jgi:hypothetical protein
MPRNLPEKLIVVSVGTEHGQGELTKTPLISAGRALNGGVRAVPPRSASTHLPFEVSDRSLADHSTKRLTIR